MKLKLLLEGAGVLCTFWIKRGGYVLDGILERGLYANCTKEGDSVHFRPKEVDLCTCLLY
jgi:hypothetical protein